MKKKIAVFTLCAMLFALYSSVEAQPLPSERVARGFMFWCVLLVVIVLGAGNPSASWGHDVGEPALQELPIWTKCCGDGDCVAQNVQIIGNAPGKKIDVKIQGTETYVDKDKFSPVPSNRTWVCYVSPSGAVSNENIRCILHPQSGGTN